MHCGRLHISTSALVEPDTSQSSPPYFGLGLVHSRVLVLRPTPHVELQLLHCCQLDHDPCTAKYGYGFQNVKCKKGDKKEPFKQLYNFMKVPFFLNVQEPSSSINSGDCPQIWYWEVSSSHAKALTIEQPASCLHFDSALGKS